VVRDDLQDVPVLDDLAVGVETDDVDPGAVVVAGPAPVAVQDDEVVLGDRAQEPHLLAGGLPRHPVDVDERRPAVADVRVVLGVRGTGAALDGLGRAALVEHQVVGLPHRVLVALQPVGVARGSVSSGQRAGAVRPDGRCGYSQSCSRA
jgi:hypothetical protein